MQKQKIDIICNDGSPMGVCTADIYGENGRVGVGGAELALLTMCEAWTQAGHEVRLYNDPKGVHSGSSFRQYPISSFERHDNRDVLIIFRSPNRRARDARGKKIWWSTDQYTVGDFKEFSQQVDKVVTISPFHAQYFQTAYGIGNTHIIDLPVRLWDYTEPIPKVKHRIIFCSVPDRGLPILAHSYDELVRAIPDLSLVITSDYRLWGAAGAMNEQHIRKFFGKPNVRFMGAVPRRELVIEQLKADVQAYPCSYDELFCYSVAECQTAGALPITSDRGALSTTNMGIQIVGDVNSGAWRQAFTETVISQLQSKELKEIQSHVREQALKRFSIDRILGEWQQIFQ